MAESLQYGLEGNQSYSLYYTHTGKVPFLGIFLTLFVALPTGLILAFAYGYADLYSPEVRLNLVITLAYGAALGYVCSRIMHWGKMRSMPVALSVIGTVALISYFSCWVFWIFAFSNRNSSDGLDWSDVLYFFTHPQNVVSIAARLNEHGTWSMGNSYGSSTSHNDDAVSGIALTLIWIGEAALIFFLAFKMGMHALGERPFCEKCNDWCSAGRTLRRIGVAPNAVELKERLERKDFSILAELAPKAQSYLYQEVVYHHCPKCRQLHTLSLARVTVTLSKKRRAKIKRKWNMKFLLLTAEDVQILLPAPAQPLAQVIAPPGVAPL